MLNSSGIVIGLASFVIIGIFHPVVIKCEYYFTSKVWPAFLVLGLVCCVASLLIEDDIFSGIVGVFGFASLWSIHELRRQSERVARGWFPRNPSRNVE